MGRHYNFHVRFRRVKTIQTEECYLHIKQWPGFLVFCENASFRYEVAKWIKLSFHVVIIHKLTI